MEMRFRFEMEDSMKRIMNYTAAAALCAALWAPSGLMGQQPASPSSDPKLDPDAISALRKMGDYLRTLDQFQVTGAITTDEVLVDSQKVQMAKHVDLIVDRPNRLRMQVKSDKHERLFLYDGNSFTMFAPRMKYYATIEAPANIAELAKLLEDKHDIELPFVDLFRWGTSDSRIAEIKAAKFIGSSECEGVTCEHYAFRMDGLDWEIWIQNGDYPLPHKIVLTTLTDQARPQYAATYKWNLAPSFNEQAFVFVAPPDAKKITLADLTLKPSLGTSSKD
jgi:hypothetical protein